MFENLSVFENRYEELNLKLYDPTVAADRGQYAALMKEHKEITPIVEQYRALKKAEADMEGAQQLLDDPASDRELRQMAAEELNAAREDAAKIAETLKVLLLPRDPNDERSVIVEIRGGAGGQHINKTSSAIRVTHLPTGTVVECQDERSQYKNKDKALRVLRARLLDAKVAEQNAEIAANRRSQVGTGDRSERIRTYNYPQLRVTDHRIGLTLYRLADILNGDLDEIIDALIAADRAEKLRESRENG